MQVDIRVDGQMVGRLIGLMVNNHVVELDSNVVVYQDVVQYVGSGTVIILPCQPM